MPESTLRKVFLQSYLCNLLNSKATLFSLFFTQVLSVNSGPLDKLWYASIHGPYCYLVATACDVNPECAVVS